MGTVAIDINKNTIESSMAVVKTLNFNCPVIQLFFEIPTKIMAWLERKLNRSFFHFCS